MKKIKLLSLMLISILFAGNPNKIGTAGGQILTLSADPRGLALNGAHFGSVTGLSAIYYNPAGLGSLSQLAFNVSQINYLADTKLSQIAFGFKVGEASSLALSTKFFDVGDIDVTTDESPTGTGEIINPSISVIGITFAQQFTQSISFGATLNFLSENYLKVTGSAQSLDLGLQYKTTQGINFGIALKNVGTNVKYDGNALKSFGEVGTENSPFYIGMESPALPTLFVMSLNYVNKFDTENSINLMGTFTNINQGLDRLTAGLEYSYEETFFARGSFQSIETSNSSVFNGLGFGFGVRLAMSESSNLDFDYSYRGVDVAGFKEVNAFGFNLSF